MSSLQVEQAGIQKFGKLTLERRHHNMAQCSDSHRHRHQLILPIEENNYNSNKATDIVHRGTNLLIG